MNKGPAKDKRIAATNNNHSAILITCINALRWRLEESASWVQETASAMERGDEDRALKRLLAIEPLLYDTDRLLAASLILERDGRLIKS